MVPSVINMYVFGEHQKTCMETLKHKLIQHRLKRLQLDNSQHYQLCSVDYLA